MRNHLTELAVVVWLLSSVFILGSFITSLCECADSQDRHESSQRDIVLEELITLE